MKFYLMPKEPTWWLWLVIASLLTAGIAGQPLAFVAAIILSVAQGIYFLWKHRSFAPFPVQIRLAYAACLLAYYPPSLRWLNWVPMAGTFALLLFGYCLMARLLSLMPWNRREPLSVSLLIHTFFTAPVIGRAEHGLPACGGSGSLCDLEARASRRHGTVL